MESSERWWVAPCGIDCAGCTIHTRAEEELDYWRKQNADLDKIRCDGCRSDPAGHHWSPDCEIRACCLNDHRLEFCAQCPEFSCAKLDAWGREFEHHQQAVERLREMKRAGIDAWFRHRRR